MQGPFEARGEEDGTTVFPAPFLMEVHDGLFAHSPRHFASAARGLHRGWLRNQFWINIVLTLMGYLPGIVHAVYIIGSHGAHARAY